jgi:hypothetical protein
MDLTQRVLNRLRGRLDITVSHSQIAGKLIVKGATNCALDYGWEEMPPEMKVDRAVYCCRPAWDEALPAIFVFADEVTVVDAPADMVVDEMLDMMYEMGSHGAVERLENGEPDEVDEGEE